jgi:hypothetical protein
MGLWPTQENVSVQLPLSMEPSPLMEKPMGAPGLAFETWDPSNQFPLETAIPSLS